MKNAIRCSSELLRFVGLPDRSEDLNSAEKLFAGGDPKPFPTFVPIEFAKRIRRGDPNDPILRQVLAVSEESVESPGFVSDPVGDLLSSQSGGILHKYSGRALIVTHGACAVHCRYCFRREFPYAEHNAQKTQWAEAIDYIRNDSSIEEVLLSGGDPLTLSDAKLEELINSLASIEHVKRIRIHSRLPIVIPQRITDKLVAVLKEAEAMVWFVIHSNHSHEFDSSVADAISKLRRSGIPLMNQSVLLAGVNDDIDTLTDLSNTLINLGVQPYYLHQLDHVRGASHFWVPPETGLQLVEEMRSRLPGYAVPTFVVEQPGESSKTVVR
ncbi:EF-P beta-lysylation protein EpmB [Stieleria sp. JC731]|uniref:EF-P beta-lysylation protein EpmB n=1 Tax=Pirellulaceae TaxID=2691357 RepID=UPI001E4E95F6|nr:EF-P beta-lysylation protein EpmB [Stieleria sp. JC731]MCC9603580.1 EF-P beta-lysylation protein EpmB [Stieleria sp. JC731]